MPHLAEALAAGGYLRDRPRSGSYVHQPEQRRDRHRRFGRAQRHRRQPLPRPGGPEVQVTDPSFLRADDDSRRSAARPDVHVLCVTAKEKLRRLLADDGVPAFSAEPRTSSRSGRDSAHRAYVGRPNPASTTGELSPYTIDLAVALAQHLRRDARVRVADRLRAARRRARRAAGRRVLPRGRRLRSAGHLTRASSSDSPPTTGCGRRPPRRHPERSLPRRGSGRGEGARADTRCARSPTLTSSTTRRSDRSPGCISTISASSIAPAAHWRR